jgi:hypothetical protein
MNAYNYIAMLHGCDVFRVSRHGFVQKTPLPLNSAWGAWDDIDAMRLFFARREVTWWAGGRVVTNHHKSRECVIIAPFFLARRLGLMPRHNP